MQRQPSHDGLYLLRDIGDPTKMVGELEEWAKSVKSNTGATEEMVGLWQMQIAEVTTNSFQRGVRYSRAQEAKASNIAGKAFGSSVQLAALDYGSTIPRVIQETAKRDGIRLRDGDLIRHACKLGVTSRSVKQNQGAGLHSLVNTVKDCQGSLIILSRNGLVHVCGNRQYRRTLKPIRKEPVLAVTLTIVKLRIN